MLTRRRRLLSHASLALGMGVLCWLFLLQDSDGVADLLHLAAAGASVLVGAGFAARFVSVWRSRSEAVIPADPPAPGQGMARHWTENALMIWMGLCISALTTEVLRAGGDSQRVLSALPILMVVGVFAMQGVRLLRAERSATATTGSVS